MNYYIWHQGFSTKKYWPYSDKYGRGILSRLIVGTRVSLSVGMSTVLISVTTGSVLAVWKRIAGCAECEAKAMIAD